MNTKALVAGNWKMNLDHIETVHLVQQIGVLLRTIDHVSCDVVVLPPAVDLRSASSVIDADRLAIDLGAQHMSHFDSGAYTGEIAASMLRRLSAKYVVVGHSERRTMFHMDDATVALTFNAAIRAGLTPILCVGESAEIRQSNHHEQFVSDQIASAVSESLEDELVVAYEPIWSIGTGATASHEQIRDMVSVIRRALPPSLSTKTRILYGGSVAASNAREIGVIEGVDGFLVGGASLRAEEFIQIVSQMNDCYAEKR